MSDAQSVPEYRASQYIGSLTAIAALTALITSLALILASNGDAITLRPLPPAVSPLPRAPWLIALAVSALVAASAAISLARLVIRAIRILTYTNALRGYCDLELRRAGIPTMGALLPLGSTSQIATRWPAALLRGRDSGSGRVLRRVAQSRHTLILGPEGAGKTTTLVALARRDVSPLASLGVVLGLRRLPALISLPGLASASSALLTEAPPDTYLARQFARLGSEGLAARAPAMMKRGALTLLCDDYDTLEPDGREAVNHALARWLEPPSGRCRIIVACDSDRFDHDLDNTDLLDSLTVERLLPLSDRLLARMALITVSGSGRRETTRMRLRDVSARSVSSMVSIPAVARALTEVIASGEAPAPSYAALLRQALLLKRDAAAHALPAGLAGPHSGAEQSAGSAANEVDVALLWGALAASLEGVTGSALPLDPTRTMGESAERWLTAHPPLPPVSFALQTDPNFTADALEHAIKTGIDAGVLRRQVDGLGLTFAHHIMRKAATAYWLDTMDNGLGRLNSALLASPWIAPVVLWAGARPDGVDIAQRIYRLTQSPESVAARAGLSRASDVAPVALALALAAAITSVEPVVIATEPNDQLSRRRRFAAQQELRDLLDAMAIMAADATRRPALMYALRQARERVGPSLDASMRGLIGLERLDRLARAQLTLVLGLLATPEALDELIRHFNQTDLTIRQAARQALIYAGPEAIPLLQRLASEGDAQTRQRADEALSFVSAASPGASGAVSAAAMTGLGSADARQRRVAVTTLSALRAPEALDALVARLDDTSLEVQIAAVRALGQLGAPAGLAALRKRIAAPSPALRRAIAEALGMTVDAESLAPLFSLLGDREPAVRAAAAIALGAQGDRRAAGPLREATQDEDPWVRRAAHAAARRLTGG